MSIRPPAALAVLAMLVAPPLARADDWGGVNRAEAAGIEIDAAAKPIMASAPRGTCLNDPTQAKCGHITAVHADAHILSNGWTGYGAIAPATTALSSPAVADSFFQCAVYAQYPVKSTGYARANASNTCTAYVGWQELIENLYQWPISGGYWKLLKQAYASGPGGRTLRTHVDRWCWTKEVRAWRNQATGFSHSNGHIYTGVQNKYDNLYCRAKW